jgi:glycosyltransferase involved in cell wall biosynthesis
LRLLWIGDAGVHSGFGTVTHSIGERLLRDYGHDIHVIAVNYQGDYWDTPLKLYPASLKMPHDLYGQSRYVELLGRVMPDAIVFVNDPAVVLSCLLDNSWDPEKVLWRGILSEPSGVAYRPPIFAYMPIDGYDSPRAWDALGLGVTRIAMSQHGSKALGGAPVVHHGVDTSVFYPRDKRECKALLGFDPDQFLVLRVDKNSIRKDYPSTWRAMRPLLRKHSDMALHFHCRIKANDGYDLRAFAWNDEDIRDVPRLTFSPDIGGFTGWGQEKLALLYAAADLFVSTSWGEGFGLTIAEALASGTPVVAQDCSAITEVVGPGGLLVKPHHRIATPMGQDQCFPDVAGFTSVIERLYRDHTLRRRLAEAGVAHIRALADWDRAAAQFDSILQAQVASTIEPAPVEVLQPA